MPSVDHDPERDLMRAVARGLRDDVVGGEGMTADPDTNAPADTIGRVRDRGCSTAAGAVRRRAPALRECSILSVGRDRGPWPLVGN
jgi:hypothetical protein